MEIILADELNVIVTPVVPEIVVKITVDGEIQVFSDGIQVRAELHNYAIDFPLAASAVELDEETNEPFVRILL